jgi:hypothetical protein
MSTAPSQRRFSSILGRFALLGLASSAWLATPACENSDFSGQTPQKASDDGKDDDEDDDESRNNEDLLGQTSTSGLGTDPLGNGTGTGVGTGLGGLGTGTDAGQGEPIGLVTSGGSLIATPDYTTCAALPQAGKRGYGKCDAQQVVVIVNDGKAQEMTCCPVQAQNILSTKPDEQHVQRVGLCLGEEVATGMVEPHAPGVYCTKINTQYMRLSAPVVATYVNNDVPGVLGQIAATYNVSDTCICPEGFVVIGGHTAQDNTCADQCVRIERRP